MQDITEESEDDFQSVFNKISESLKSINQETIVKSIESVSKESLFFEKGEANEDSKDLNEEDEKNVEVNLQSEVDCKNNKNKDVLSEPNLIKESLINLTEQRKDKVLTLNEMETKESDEIKDSLTEIGENLNTAENEKLISGKIESEIHDNDIKMKEDSLLDLEDASEEITLRSTTNDIIDSTNEQSKGCFLKKAEIVSHHLRGQKYEKDSDTGKAKNNTLSSHAENLNVEANSLSVTSAAKTAQNDKEIDDSVSSDLILETSSEGDSFQIGVEKNNENKIEEILKESNIVNKNDSTRAIFKIDEIPIVKTSIEKDIDIPNTSSIEISVDLNKVKGNTILHKNENKNILDKTTIFESLAEQGMDNHSKPEKEEKNLGSQKNEKSLAEDILSENLNVNNGSGLATDENKNEEIIQNDNTEIEMELSSRLENEFKKDTLDTTDAENLDIDIDKVLICNRDKVNVEEIPMDISLLKKSNQVNNITIDEKTTSDEPSNQDLVIDLDDWEEKNMNSNENVFESNSENRSSVVAMEIDDEYEIDTNKVDEKTNGDMLEQITNQTNKTISHNLQTENDSSNLIIDLIEEDSDEENSENSNNNKVLKELIKKDGFNSKDIINSFVNEKEEKIHEVERTSEERGETSNDKSENEDVIKKNKVFEDKVEVNIERDENSQLEKKTSEKKEEFTIENDEVDNKNKETNNTNTVNRIEISTSTIHENEKAQNINVENLVGLNDSSNKIDIKNNADKTKDMKIDIVESQNKEENVEDSKNKLKMNEKGSNENLSNNSSKLIDLKPIEKNEITSDAQTFYNKDCINYECKKKCKIYFLSPIFVLNLYRVVIKPNSAQYICDDCYDAAVNHYEEWCNLLHNQQPILLSKIPQKTNEFVEILDSSDEDENSKKKYDEESRDFDSGTTQIFENEINDIIGNVLSKNKIQNQLTWSKTILQHRLDKVKENCNWIESTLNNLQKNADKMNLALYQCPKIEMKYLAPFDLNTNKTFILGESSLSNQHSIPPIGEIHRPTIVLNGDYYAAKNKVIASWLPSKIVEIVEPALNDKQKTVKYYKVKFFKMKVPTYKTVPAKHLAYCDVPRVQLSIGTRVIALFDASTLYKTKEYRGPDIKSAFYPGVIAEALQPYNNYRYLIFFDDGYTQYVQHRDVRLICEVSANVWDDIHLGSREFIQNYLINYKKNRPMVQVKKGQSMVTELNGKWIYAKVLDVDASLIQMLFEGQKNHTEWIYRGSTRLGPLFKAIQKTNVPQVTRLPRRSEPFVRYMQDDENAKQNQQQQNQQQQQSVNTTQVRSQVARKSTARQESQEPQMPAAAVKHLNNSTIFVDDEEPKGTLVYYSSKSENNPPPRSFRPHMCNPNCIIREHFEGNYGVLSKPLLNSWERAIYKIKTKRTSVVYRAPCGRNLRNIEEVHKYLRLTRNKLNVENFVFDPEVGCLNEYQVKKCIVNKSDITEGREKIPIQCVNYYDHTMPPECEYSAERIPTEGVNLNVDPEFLVGCDCKDDCTDKSKCSCWNLTLEGARYGNPHTPIENIGYYFKRLLEPVSTGIYECNSRCKCNKKCINRVVQHSLETKLQVFKTSNRGWGLRCINDVPKGSFICVYAGNLLTEQKANECGDGDEYFAELDYIEVAERLKEGYESDVGDENDSDEYQPERDSDEEFSTRSTGKINSRINTRNRTASAKRSNSSTTNGLNDDDDEQERQTINFVPNTQLENYEDITTKYKSMRRLFGKNEYCYVMDAKSIGNVGRYFNHSCSPNLFVQNVFVDTHDLRFPWVAFFALSNIRAGTELTWNYNYEVGVVPGKVLYCQCGATNCRGRLL